MQIGYTIKDVPKDGNCGLHAVIDQLHIQGLTDYSVISLHQKAVDVIDKRGLPEGFIDKTEYRDAADYMYKQRKSGTWCDEPMLRGVCTVIGKSVSIIHENGHQSTLHPGGNSSDCSDTPLVIGMMTDFHYVSLHPLLTTQLANTVSHQQMDTDEITQELNQSDVSEVTNVEKLTDCVTVEKLSSSDDNTMLLPHCISLVMWKAWSKSREWLTADNRKVYCRVCCETYKTGFSAMKASVGVKLKLHFINGVTTDHLEKSRDKQRKTLLKKTDKHARSQTRAVSIHIKQQALKSELEEAVQKAHTVWEEVNAEKNRCHMQSVLLCIPLCKGRTGIHQTSSHFVIFPVFCMVLLFL